MISSFENVGEAQSTCERLMEGITAMIDEEIPQMMGLPRPLLQIEAVICLGTDGPVQGATPQKRILAIIDMKSWHNRQSLDLRREESASNDAEADGFDARGRSGNTESETDSEALREAELTKRRKVVGSLRLARTTTNLIDQPTPPRTPSPEPSRKLQTNLRNFPQRKRQRKTQIPALRPLTWDRLVLGIWEQIHGPIRLDWTEQGIIPSLTSTFRDANTLCLRVSQASRRCRSLEVIVQAHWVECYDAHVEAIVANQPMVSLGEAKKTVLNEACRDFGWSEKYLRNKMAVWRGYREIKNAGGWVALAFAGTGVYRYCKYRIGFDQNSMLQLQRLRKRFDVAADTLHPEWRALLSAIGAPSDRVYTGHPHDWVVDEDDDPVPLSASYQRQDPEFTYKHMTHSVIDENVWEDFDPRRISDSVRHICDICGCEQSDDAAANRCTCFPDLYGDKRCPCPVQIFRTKNGRNNGLIACCPFERGTAIGEFVGLITRGVTGIDVMEGRAGETSYQIWQGKQGNYTRFVNHSCQPNSQFQKFTWLGVERIILVSKGVEAGKEITVDYGDGYWRNLDKKCLCGEIRCRYRL